MESPLECEGYKCKIRKIDPKHCSKFSFHVRNTGTTINNIVAKEGKAELECKFPEGTLTAKFEFESCH